MTGYGEYLELTTPGEPGRTIPLDRARILIGRIAGSDIKLGGAYVSRRHARLERDPAGGWRIIDMGSSNGSFVNGRRVQLANLGDGDVLAIGTYRLTLHDAGAREPVSGVITATDSQREIVPSGASSIVVDQAELPPDRVVPARLLAVAHEAGRRLGRAADIPSLLEGIGHEFHAILKPKRLAVGREDGPEPEWPVVVDAAGHPASGADLPHILVPRVEALRTSLVVSWDELAAAAGSVPGTRRNAQSYLFPIQVGGRRIGHVYVEFGKERSIVPDEAMDLLSLLARQAALIWENLDLQAARRAADELNRELSAARQIQLHLFPERRDLDPRVDIAAENVPALGVSGDYYDFQLLEPGRIVFILADVMGHGLPAALLMASVQAVFRTGVHAGWDLLRLDRHIHHAVEATGQGETFVTGILGLCDLTSHKLSLLSAGHSWPSIWCSERTIPQDEQACSPPWGIFVERSPQPSSHPLEPDDWSIVAYTDGLADSQTGEGRPYGADRLVDVHRRYRAAPAVEICDGILNDVFSASDDSVPQQDDMTLLVLRSAGSGASARRTPAPSERVEKPAPPRQDKKTEDARRQHEPDA